MKHGPDRRKNSTNVRFMMLQAWSRLLSAVAPRRAEAFAADTFMRPIRPSRPHVPEVLGRPAHEFHIATPSSDLKVWDWGDGPTVLLVHGWNGTASQMAPFVAPLVNAGFYVVAFDQPAHGSSSGERTHLVDMAQAVATVGKRVGPIAGVIAHSLGAAATTLAMSEGLSVNRAVFIAPPLEPSRYFHRMTKFLGLSEARSTGAEEILVERVGRSFSSLDARRHALGASVPLLVMHDKDDVEVPWLEGAAIANAWEGARLTTLHGLGHVKPLRTQAVISEAVSFLSSPRSKFERQSA